MSNARPGLRVARRLVVMTETPHWAGANGEPMAYEPYVREIRIWATLFETVTICYPEGEGERRGDVAPYACGNVDFVPMRYSLRAGPASALKRLRELPAVAATALREIRRADLTLVRSPSHVGLVGALVARLTGTPSITKWAGENGAYRGERLPSRIDRLLQSIPSTLHPVLVYGPARRPHQISFLPALMTDEEIARARTMSEGKLWGPPWRILCVGKLLPVKGFDLALGGLGELRRRRPDVPWSLTIVGEGSARSDLERAAASQGIADRVRFLGALPFSEVQRQYADAHLVVMPGVKEGWPKVIAEAWAHGAVPLGAAAGLVAWILQGGRFGFPFEPTASGLAEALDRVFEQRGELKSLAASLYARAEDMSLERFRRDLVEVLVDRLGFGEAPRSQAVVGGS